jgi:predicted transcriptional regulator
MTDEAGLETTEVLDAVARRANVIECLLDGPKYNRDVRSTLDVSRSTVYKAFSELDELDVVQPCSHGYELTAFGRLLYDEYSQFHRRFEEVCRAGPLLAVLPVDVDVPFVMLDGADVYVSTRHAPHSPVHAIERVVREASAVKGTAPVILPSYVDLFTEQVVDAELEASLVFERPVFEHLTTDYEEDYSTAFRSERLEVWVTDRELPFGLLVIEAPTPQAGLVVYDQGGELKGFVLNDDEACDWASREWESVRDDAMLVSDDLGP